MAPGIEYAESRWTLECHLYEMRSDQSFSYFDSLLALPTLGTSSTGDTAKDPDYFVYPRGRRPRIRAIPQRRGGVRYLLDASAETVHFRSGDPHDESGAFIVGRVARSVQTQRPRRLLVQGALPSSPSWLQQGRRVLARAAGVRRVQGWP